MGGWSTPRPGRFTLGKARHLLYRRLGGPQGRSGQVGKISPHGDSIPGPSSLKRVSIPTELSRSNLTGSIIKWTSFSAISISFPRVYPLIFSLKSHSFYRKVGSESVETLFYDSNLWPVIQYRRDLMWFYIPGNVFSGRTSGYHGAGTKADLDNHSQQKNRNNSKYQGWQ